MGCPRRPPSRDCPLAPQQLLAPCYWQSGDESRGGESLTLTHGGVERINKKESENIKYEFSCTLAPQSANTALSALFSRTPRSRPTTWRRARRLWAPRSCCSTPSSVTGCAPPPQRHFVHPHPIIRIDAPGLLVVYRRLHAFLSRSQSQRVDGQNSRTGILSTSQWKRVDVDELKAATSCSCSCHTASNLRLQEGSTGSPCIVTT